MATRRLPALLVEEDLLLRFRGLCEKLGISQQEWMEDLLKRGVAELSMIEDSPESRSQVPA